MNDPKQGPVHKEVENMEDSMESYANIMAAQKPNPLGKGYIKLYLLSVVVFLCSTMNGESSAPDASIPGIKLYADNIFHRIRQFVDGIDQCAAKLYRVLWFV